MSDAITLNFELGPHHKMLVPLEEADVTSHEEADVTSHSEKAIFNGEVKSRLFTVQRDKYTQLGYVAKDEFVKIGKAFADFAPKKPFTANLIKEGETTLIQLMQGEEELASQIEFNGEIKLAPAKEKGSTWGETIRKHQKTLILSGVALLVFASLAGAYATSRFPFNAQKA